MTSAPGKGQSTNASSSEAPPQNPPSTTTPSLGSVPASNTTLTLAPASGAGVSPPTGGNATSPPAPAPRSSQRQPVDVAAKSSVGADDSILLAGLVMVFALAVSGVVIIAGHRAGRR